MALEPALRFDDVKTGALRLVGVGQHAAPSDKSGDPLYAFADIVIALALVSLFVPLKAHVGVVQIRPFDFLTLILFGIVAARMNRLPSPVSWIGFSILIPYFTWHVISAFTYGEINGIREALQTRRDLVRPDAQVRKPEAPFSVCRRLGGNVGLNLPRRHNRAGRKCRRRVAT